MRGICEMFINKLLLLFGIKMVMKKAKVVLKSVLFISIFLSILFIGLVFVIFVVEDA